jgi:5-methylcytosine-specific restriction enzyme subunit McrC
MPRQLTLAEAGPPQSMHLSEAEAAALAATGLAMPERSASPGEWQVVAGRKVGALQIGPNLQVTVTPKVTIDRLVFMMGYARNPDFWRDEPVRVPQHEDFTEALAHTFHRLTSRAFGQGLLHGYRTVDDSLHVVRGRIRTDDQLRQRYQMPLPIEVRYDEFSVDIAENQILLAAVLCLLRLSRVSVETRRGLQRLRVQLADVTQHRSGTPLPSWQASRLNARYQPALRIAELVLAASSFDLRASDVRIDVSGFLFDAWKIFEDFVCVALAEALRTESGHPQLQHRGYLDVDHAIPIEPDFTWWRGNLARAVVDAKYKMEKSNRYPNADTYQVLAYCTALGLDEGHLIYARGEAEQRSYRVNLSPVTIHCHALDLAGTSQDLLTRIRALAEFICSPQPVDKCGSAPVVARTHSYARASMQQT